MSDYKGTDNVHSLSMKDRKTLTIEGIEDVESFNEEIVTLITVMGVLIITGENFKINKLHIEHGKIDIEGDIEGINYSPRERKAKEGFFKRIFK